MRNLFTFIWRNHFYFLFALLEVIAFALIINSTVYQRWVFVNSTQKITGSVYSVYANLQEYFNLRNTNQILARENALLHQALQHPTYRHDEKPFGKDSLPYPSQYQYIDAKVISNTVTLRNNYLMLNKGKRHGVDKDMAVISSNGIVGIVINASNNFSWVMSVLNDNTKINGKLLKDNYQGSLTWDGGNYRTGTLSDLPAHVGLAQGDTIVTSGYSLLFPEGIMIGTIEDFNIGKGDHFYTIKVHFSVDYNNLRYVYVVKNLMRKEQISVMKHL
ncbi:MAG: rod shape-determining protein MreC [Bacteroidales bacterium]|nr:rod shape-determining protein MreC [Bacteroidales bacterium]MDZ4205198.1 rod shape-determining protein MreC [Bacteroidales bacterium]